MKDKFLSIKKDAVTETVIEKSRFICSAKRVVSEEEAKSFVAEIKRKYSDATHNCYAYIADSDGFYIRFSDDGEPQGTAGIPMLESLKNREVFCTAMVVTRYFGGIKLGTGGLARAYSDCVLKTLDAAGVIENVFSLTLKTEVSYNVFPLLLKFIESKKAIKNGVEYLNNGVSFTFTVPSGTESVFIDKIRDFSSGKSAVLKIGEGYFEY